MSQPRMNLYGFPHKGLRNAIAQLSLLAGNADSADAASLGALQALGHEVFTLLELHAHSEETVVLPALEARVPGSTADNIDEHRQLEAEVEAMQRQLEALATDSPPGAAAGFYAAVANFHGRYLAHMAMEETTMNALIWDNFTDEELMGQHGRVMASLTPEQIMMWFRYIVPALNPFERTIIMTGFKANAPAPFFDAVMAALSGLMGDDEYRSMAESLG